MEDKEQSLYSAERSPREDFWEEETEELCELLQNRGDQRIGQFILNTLAENGITEKEEICNNLWNIEADELLELAKQLEKRT